ncbi:hypothetical protein [Litorimonas sp. WD9-15]|uniref:hypothetical protein n=1 Tax=Litorimonas sp. WD9-15 TaxID=3418716 RepID=UPI003D00230E
MGAPTSGELSLDDLPLGPGFGPSAVWSTDSKFLVVPRWIRNAQILSLINADTKEMRIGTTRFSVLELEALEGKKLTGVNSPIYQPTLIEIDIATEFKL